MKYKATYCCMPHPLYAEVSIDAANEEEAIQKAERMRRDHAIPHEAWYFNVDNVIWSDVDLRWVEAD